MKLPVRSNSSRSPEAKRSACPAVLLTALFLGLLLPAVTPAFAADAADASAAQAQYEKERARCESGPPGDERATCLQSAGAALEEAKSGHLDVAQHPYAQNRIDRCTPLPPAERDDCVRRMQGQGAISGSVQGGGIYRETDTLQVVPAPPSGPAVTPGPDR